MISATAMKIITKFAASTQFKFEECLEVLVLDWYARHLCEERHLGEEAFPVPPFLVQDGHPILGMPLFEYLEHEYSRILTLQLDRVKRMSETLNRLQKIVKEDQRLTPVPPEIVNDSDDEEDSERKLDS